jgi:3-oxoacyl-[acyl-carrier-protein] synthase II
MEDVVLSGIGVWCSIAHGVSDFSDALCGGKCGYASIPAERFDTSSPVYRTRCAYTLPFNVISEFETKDNLVLKEFAYVLAEEALTDGRLVDKHARQEMALVLATTVGGTYPFMSYLRAKNGLPGGSMDAVVGQHTAGSIAGGLAHRLGLRGPVSTISTACASGANSIGRAFDIVRRGRAHYALAGGIDIFSELAFSGFNCLQALAKGPCRPFDVARDGMALGDGGAVVLVERRSTAESRGATIYSCIRGYGIGNEAHHRTGPDPNGVAALRAMQSALEQGGLCPENVGYVNAHGTATPANDAMEVKALHDLFGSHASDVFVSSTKAMTGHTLGAAGSLEAVATALALHYKFVPATINTRDVMPSYLCIVTDKALDADINVGLSNSFGFGGNVASLALSSARWHNHIH